MSRIERVQEKTPKATPQGRYKTAQAVVVALLVVGLLTAIFILQNTARTKVHFLFWSASVPLAGALILATVLGGIIAFLVVFVRQRRRARESRDRLASDRVADDGVHEQGG
jgi:uncharacterized integral membrane protein